MGLERSALFVIAHSSEHSRNEQPLACSWNERQKTVGRMSDQSKVSRLSKDVARHLQCTLTRLHAGEPAVHTAKNS